ncbi:MAG: hypothetical protein IJY23_05765 [Clostridia bacterium]|nr:hypothetical protein [Clostridia bacterium]
MMKKLSFFASCDDGEALAFVEREDKKIRRFSLGAESFKDKKMLRITAPQFETSAGDNGYYLLPGDEKASGTALVRFAARSMNEKIRIDNPSLSIFAVANAEEVYVVMIENTYLYVLESEYVDGKYKICVEILTARQPVYDDIVFKVITLPASADYNDVARAVRNYRLEMGEIRPLRDKCAERESLEYARKYPLIRIRMGWKPVPPQILHQTEENEPPMYVACTFADVRFLADKMKEQGVEGAELSLVGWNAKGHDGRWPDLFPVEEMLGGESELIKTIEHVKSLGYKISCHTNHADHYEIAKTFNLDDLARNADGSVRSHGNWGGGTSYAACPVTQLRYAERDVKELVRLGFSGLHYVDCLSICRPDTCFDKNHRVTLSGAIEILRKIMNLYTEKFGGFSSEGMRDFSVGELDFSLYNCFRSTRLSFLPKDYEMVDAVIPMMELIYHGIVLYNVSSATVNAIIKGDEAKSTLALLGGKSALYINSKFLSAKKNVFSGISNNWMGEEDITSESREALTEAARLIYDSAKEYEALCDRQLVFIKSYKTLDGGICVTRYEDGVEIVANFGKETAAYRGKEILPSKYVRIEA